MLRAVRSRAAAAGAGALSAAYWARYDRYHRADASAALVGLTRSGCSLPPRLRRACDEDAHDRLGSGAYAPWLYVYAAMAGQFRPGWLPDNYYGRWVVPVLANGLETLAAARSLGRRVLDAEALPDVAYVIDGRLYDLDMAPTTTAAVAEVLDGHPVIHKADGSSRGRGVRRLTADQVRELDVELLADGVLQRWVVQHPFFARAMPESVGTLRITTVLEPDGDVGVRARLLRLGRSGRQVVAAGSLFSSAVDDDGTICPVGIISGWMPSAVHPDTGVALGGRRIPGFTGAIDLVRALHRRVPQVGLIGWDLAIDDQEAATVLEWNVGHSGITHSEAMVGPCFLGLGWDRWHLREARLDPQ